MGGRMNRTTPWVAVMVVVMAVVVAQNARLTMALDIEVAKNWAKSKISGKWSVSKVKEGAGNVAYKTVDASKQGGKGLHVSGKAEEVSEVKKACHDAGGKGLHVFMKDEVPGVQPQEAAQQQPNEEATQPGANVAQEGASAQQGGVVDTLKQAAEKVGQATAPPAIKQDAAAAADGIIAPDEKPLPGTSWEVTPITPEADEAQHHSSTRTHGVDDSSIHVSEGTVIELEDDTT